MTKQRPASWITVVLEFICTQVIIIPTSVIISYQNHIISAKHGFSWALQGGTPFQTRDDIWPFSPVSGARLTSWPCRGCLGNPGVGSLSQWVTAIEEIWTIRIHDFGWFLSSQILTHSHIHPQPYIDHSLKSILPSAVGKADDFGEFRLATGIIQWDICLVLLLDPYKASGLIVS